MDVPSRFKKISEWLEETDNYGDVQLYKNDETGIALFYLNNSSKRNALTGKMMVKFSKLINELETWKKGKAVIVYGSRNFFCSGLNLNLVKQIIGREWHSTQMALLMTDNFRRLRNLPLITIALVEEKALGGGAEFATNLDMRILTDSAQIGFVHKKMGISTAWQGAISLTKLLGPFKAIEILLSARLIGAEEAYSLGLANYVINKTTLNSPSTDDSDKIISNLNQPNQLNQPQQSQSNTHLNSHLNSVKEIESIDQIDSINLETLKPIALPIQCLKMNVSNENRINYCKRIFKRLKKKNEEKEDKLNSKRCKLDLDVEKIKAMDKLNSKKMEVDSKSIKKLNESSKMFKKMKRILFDVEEKFVIKPDIELSSCSEDDELERLQPENLKNHLQNSPINPNNPMTNTINNKITLTNNNGLKINSNNTINLTNESNQQSKSSTNQLLIQDGQPKYKVGLSDEDDNTILNLVYNWLARLTAALETDSWSELKQLIREPNDSIDLLTHLNLKLTNKTSQNNRSNLDEKYVDNQNWQKVLKSINSVANQTV